MKVYEINRQLAEQATPIGRQKAIELIYDYETKYIKTNRYYALIGWDFHYYTLFIKYDNNNSMAEEIADCLKSIGDIKDISCEDETQVLECWVTSKEDGKTYFLQLGDYTEGVIEC